MAQAKMRSRPTQEIINRWTRFKRLTRDQLDRIQFAEEEAYAQQRDWQLIGLRKLIAFEQRLGPFWPPKMTNEQKSTALHRFQDHIFLLWREPWARIDASWYLVAGNPGYVSDMEIIHVCDKIIHADSYVLVDPAGSLTRRDEIDNFKPDRAKLAAGDSE